MKAIAKLVFMLLLVAICLSLPTKVRAGGTGYNCESPYFDECVASLDQWMGQCAYGCTYDHGGPGGGNYCYNTTYTYTDGTTVPCLNNPSLQCEVLYSSTYQNCYQTNQPSCISGCVDAYNEQYGQCLSEDCEQE